MYDEGSYDHSHKSLWVVDIASITTGSFGALINLFLLFVIKAHRNGDEKVFIVFKHLAVLDCINSFVIPLCWFLFVFTEHRFLEFSKETLIFFLVFGASVNMPYFFIMIVGIMRHILLVDSCYYQSITPRMVRGVCRLIWAIFLVLPVAVYCCYSIYIDASDSSVVEDNSVIDMLHRINSVTLIVGAFSSSLTLFILACKIIRIWSHTSDVDHMKKLKSSLQFICMFLWNTFAFSIYPVMFCVEVVLCGVPWTNKILDPHSFCLWSKITEFSLHDPKLSFAIMFLSLCVMSILNGIFLLLQPSLVNTSRRVFHKVSRCSCLCFIRRIWSSRNNKSSDETLGINREKNEFDESEVGYDVVFNNYSVTSRQRSTGKFSRYGTTTSMNSGKEFVEI